MASAQDLRFYVAVALGVAIAAGVAVVCTKKAPTGVTVVPPPSADAPLADWCPPPYAAIGGGCLAVPPKGQERHELVVYLHGMYAPAAAAEENERRARVAQVATRRGMTVLALRGKQGECSQEAAKTWFCFPSNERNAGDGPAFVAGFAGAFAAAEKQAGPFQRRVLLGFSNGGYFAVLVATRALLPFDAIAIAGAGPVEPTTAQGARPPMLLLASDEDPSVTSMLQLDQALTRAAWPHALIGREGGHALTDADVTYAITFFERTRTESLPLKPPLSTRLPHPKLVVDGGEDADIVGAAAAATAPPTTTATATATGGGAAEPSAAPPPSPDTAPAVETE